MSLRTIRELGDPVLEKRAKEIKEITPKISKLIEDMKETMYEADGVGLAAPQVGMLKRLVVIDVSAEQDQPLVMINPQIIESDGEQFGWEGCLSVPGKSGQVKLKIALDGESQGNGYQKTLAGLKMNFAVELRTPTPPSTTPDRPTIVRTGDDTNVLPLLLVMGISGLLLLALGIYGVKNRKRERGGV